MRDGFGTSSWCTAASCNRNSIHPFLSDVLLGFELYTFCTFDTKVLCYSYYQNFHAALKVSLRYEWPPTGNKRLVVICGCFGPISYPAFWLINKYRDDRRFTRFPTTMKPIHDVNNLYKLQSRQSSGSCGLPTTLDVFSTTLELKG